ncbi:hypothetical protein AWC38_SpisGene21338 [Stylophora pistillata]|uniref:MULE transposase domain-containing protein n=1 Tax=Stylophora pistillata TaxID=50429 RepID=A0A2B4RDY8_STYPI|nr:hypothetical protein AWC38_SpisGene21338 [Stylophora pistillata]
MLQVNEKKRDVQWDNVNEIAEDVIINLPRQINKHRNRDQYYDVSEAKVILQELKLLSSDYELSEECLSSNSVFSDGGKIELISAVTQKLHQSETAFAIYTCRPYIFSLGKHKDALFLIDTHPVSEAVGGNSNGKENHHPMKRKSNQEEAEVTVKRIQVDTVSNGIVDVTVCGGYVSNKESAIVIGSDQKALRNSKILLLKETFTGVFTGSPTEYLKVGQTIGPGILHKQKLLTSYKTLPLLMTKYNKETSGVLAFGTDGEENLYKAMSQVFEDAKHLRCDIHLRDNVKRKLNEYGITGSVATEIVCDIFGKVLGEVMEGGLVDCSSSREFDIALNNATNK